MTTSASVPDGLRARGSALWLALGKDVSTATGQLALEACRVADRLDRLDAYLAGQDAWLDLVEVIEGSGRYQIVVDKALAEVRQQQTTFANLLDKLGMKAGAGKSGAEATGEGASPLAQVLALVQPGGNSSGGPA